MNHIKQLQALAARVLANPTLEACSRLLHLCEKAQPEVDKFCDPALADPSKLTPAKHEELMDAMEARVNFLSACMLAVTRLVDPEEAADLQREIKRRQDRRRRRRILRVVGEE